MALGVVMSAGPVGPIFIFTYRNYASFASLSDDWPSALLRVYWRDTPTTSNRPRRKTRLRVAYSYRHMRCRCSFLDEAQDRIRIKSMGHNAILAYMVSRHYIDYDI